MTQLGGVVEGATVLVEGMNATWTAFTDDQGHAYFSLELSSYKITVNSGGNFNYEGEFKVASVAPMFVDVVLPIKGNFGNLWELNLVGTQTVYSVKTDSAGSAETSVVIPSVLTVSSALPVITIEPSIINFYDMLNGYLPQILFTIRNSGFPLISHFFLTFRSWNSRICTAVSSLSSFIHFPELDSHYRRYIGEQLCSNSYLRSQYPSPYR
jgi:hypothetical protein